MSTGLSRIEPRFAFDEMVQMSEVAAKSGLFKMTPTQVLTLMMLCESEGLHPIKALQLYDIIDGRPSLKAVALLARFLESGGSVDWHEQSMGAAEGTFTHAKTCPNGVRVRYTMEDATRAGLAHKDNWKKNPADMLVARVCSRGVRRANPAAILGLALPESDDPPEPVTVVQHKSLVDKLNGRREKPQETHQAPAAVAAELKSHQAEADRAPATEYGAKIAEAVLDFNQELSRLADANQDNLKLRVALKVPQVINAVINDYVERGVVSKEAITNEAGKRDYTKLGPIIANLWDEDSDEVEAAVGRYLGHKMTELMGSIAEPATV